MAERKPMRVVFGETLLELADAFPRMVVLDADVSSSTQTKLFAQKYPARFYNCGIAEANMVSIACGMASCGLIPVASTFAFLIALRAGDAVRSLVAYNRFNVKLAGGYSGLSDFADGASHQSVADVGVIRSIPGICVLSPSDIPSTKAAVCAMLEHDGPVYLRLSREAVGDLHEGSFDLKIGKGCRLREGGDVTIAATGAMVEAALCARDTLRKEGIFADVLEFPTIKPLDAQLLIQSAKKTGAVVTCEEHSVIGGLGSAVAEALCENAPVRLKRVGIMDRFGESGAYPEILRRHGLDADSIAQAARQLLAQSKGAKGAL